MENMHAFNLAFLPLEASNLQFKALAQTPTEKLYVNSESP